MSAIEAAAKNENIELSEIAAFGDDYIDIEMIKKCGTGVAMGNGMKELKEIAKYICESNNESGVGRWLEKNIL